MTKKNEKRSFVMYDSFLEAMKHLNDSEFRECVMKIRDYALEGIDEESQSPYVNIILAMAKPNLDSARRRYMASVENGKKGAEYGKLGGAPKGNQNARKKQPQKQPLDVDANEDVDVNEDEEVNENANADEADPSGSISVKSSFSNSSIGFSNKEIVNDSERLEENKEKEPLQEVYNFKGYELSTASEVEKESHINSNIESNNTPPVSPCSEKEPECSAARPQQQKEPGMSIDEYHQMCYEKNINKLISMRMGQIPNDDALFWRTVELYKRIFRDNNEQRAIKVINQIIKESIKEQN